MLTNHKHPFPFIVFTKRYTAFYVVFAGYKLDISCGLFVFNRCLEETFYIQDVSFIAVLNTVAVT